MILECREFALGEIWTMIADGVICDANSLDAIARMVAMGNLSR
jgi:hypothetical protein